MNRRGFTAVALVLGFSLTFVSCDRARPVPGQPAKARKLTYATSKNAWCVLPIVAVKRGMFEKHGLDVKLEYVQAAKFAMDALISSSADVANVVEVNIAFLGFTGNTNASVIATICEAYDGAIAARKDRGISAAPDLKGKKLGILQGTTSQIFAERFIAANGLTASDISIVNLTPVAIQTSMLAGEIDAGSLWEPFIYNIARELGDNAVVFRDPTSYTGFMNVTVRKDWLGKNSDTADRLLKAMIEAEAYVQSRPDDVIPLIAEEIALPAETLKEIWPLYKHELYLAPSKLTAAISSEGDWIRTTQDRFVGRDLPDYGGYILPEVLNRIDPKRLQTP